MGVMFFVAINQGILGTIGVLQVLARVAFSIGVEAFSIGVETFLVARLLLGRAWGVRRLSCQRRSASCPCRQLEC